MPNPTVEITVPRSQIADPSAFETLRQQAMGEKAGQPDEQAAAMADLVAATKLADGSQLVDTLVAGILAKENDAEATEALKAAQERLRAIGGAASKGAGVDDYRFQVNADSGDVISVRRVITVPEDTQSTKRNMDISRRMGYGPKNNSSSIGRQTHFN